MICSFLRFLALSLFGNNLTSHQIWKLDTGALAGWPVFGLAILGLMLAKKDSAGNIAIAVAILSIGMLSIWLLPKILIQYWR